MPGKETRYASGNERLCYQDTDVEVRIRQVDDQHNLKTLFEAHCTVYTRPNQRAAVEIKTPTHEVVAYLHHDQCAAFRFAGQNPEGYYRRFASLPWLQQIVVKKDRWGLWSEVTEDQDKIDVEVESFKAGLEKEFIERGLNLDCFRGFIDDYAKQSESCQAALRLFLQASQIQDPEEEK